MLYEVRYSGTLITSMRRFHPDGLMRDIGWDTLPREVKERVLKAIQKDQQQTKTKNDNIKAPVEPESTQDKSNP